MSREESDVAGLTQAESAQLWEAIERAFLDTTAYSKDAEDAIDTAVERIIAERVRVAEGERDRLRAEVEALADLYGRWTSKFQPDLQPQSVSRELRALLADRSTR